MPPSFEKPTEKKSTEDRIHDLEIALAAANARAPATQIPEHGGGDGTDVSETWSQWDQYLATQNANGWQGHTPASPPSGGNGDDKK